LRPVLRWSLALIWIAAGILSFGVYPVENSYRLLGSIGLAGALATVALYGGAAVALALGLLLLCRWRPVLVGRLQLATMAVFTLLSAGPPSELWLHPFEPLLRNPPIAAATLVMIALEAE
jgi:hypothetical protein